MANDANNIGNIAFQTRETNRAIGKRPPHEYMPEVAERWPGTLESQWVPTNPDLWRVENYHKFLEDRRQRLAHAANWLLDTLRSGLLPPDTEPNTRSTIVATTRVREELSSIDSEDEAAILAALNQFALHQGLAAGQLAYEIFNEDSGEPVAVLDLAWPDGLQAAYSQPVAVLIDEDPLVQLAANSANFKVFTSSDEFHHYVEREILA